jgi:CheY-like chemotaxis protein
LRDYLESQLKTAWPELHVVAHAANGLDALRLIDEQAPDVAFLDIRMPGLTGLDVAARLTSGPKPPQLVFVTAYDQYAVDAFEQSAVDYLLKPVNLERLEKTVVKLKQKTSTGLTLAAASLRACARGVDVVGRGQRHAHAAARERFRLAEQADVAARHAQRFGHAFEGDAGRFVLAVDDGRRARRRNATLTGRPRMALACNSNSLCTWVAMVTMPVSCGRGLTSENQTMSSLTNSSTPNRPRPPRFAVTLPAMSRARSSASGFIGCGCHDST